MKKWLVVGLVLLVLALVAGAWWIYRPGTFSEANYDRIRPGMTLARVEELLGEPGRRQAEKELPQVAD